MSTEILNEIIDRLAPNVICFSGPESSRIDQLLNRYIECPYATIDWKNYPTHKRFNNSEEITPILETFLGTTFSDTVYLSAEGLPCIIKGSMHIILNTRYHWLRPLWIWSPLEGFIIEERHFDYKTVGIIPKTADPFAQFELKKDSFCDGIFNSYEINRISSPFCGIEIHNGFISINKLLTLLQKHVPFTPWGYIDWENIEKRIVLDKNPANIVPALEKLIGNTLDPKVYVAWGDADLPLISVHLTKLLEHYRELTALSVETIIFNLTTAYLIEINPSGIITVGTLAGIAESERIK